MQLGRRNKMKYSICVIDDEIPAAGVEGIRDTELLNSSNLSYLMLQEEKPWTDSILRNLIQTLLEEKGEDGTAVWDVYGYTNPSFYINMLDHGTFRPNIVTFDWDYPGSGPTTNSELLLKDILDRTFSLVFIFSKADKLPEINAVLEKPEFKVYKERVFYLDKAVDGDDQTSTLLKAAKERYDGNFSFRFANTFRIKAAQTVDRILSDMGKASLNDMRNHLLVGESSNKDFIDFITERFRSSIALSDIYDTFNQIPEVSQGGGCLDEGTIKNIWSYRLYFRETSGDDLVRCGDIIKINNDYHIVLSADCDLSRFWKKNFGVINLVDLFQLDKTNVVLKEHLTLCLTPGQVYSSGPNNILGQIGDLPEGPFVLPFVPVGNDIVSFIGFPKEIRSQSIIPESDTWNKLSRNDKAKQALRYSFFSGTEKICSISEPFLARLVQHILATISGNGVPDYPPSIKDVIKKILVGMFTTDAAVAQPADK